MLDTTSSRRVGGRDLFIRWLWTVYVPLGILVALLALLPFRVMPGWIFLIVVPLFLYGGVAVRLIIERRKRGLAIPAPKSIMSGVLAVAALVVAGTVLLVIGMTTLTSWQGLIVAALGGFLMILSLTAPAFKLLDVLIRRLARAATRRKGTRQEPEHSD